MKNERAKNERRMACNMRLNNRDSLGVSHAEKNNQVSTLFISYTECDTPIVNIIEEKIREKLEDKIKISRYTGLKYKESFKEFMNSIQDHDYVLAVVSDTYLRRQACMYEVGETIKDHHYRDKLLFVVLSENERKYYGDDMPEKVAPNIYGSAIERLEYIAFWKKEYEKLEQTIDAIGDREATRREENELHIIGQIYRNDMGEFLQFLVEENGENFQKLYENDFDELIEWMYPGYFSNIFNSCCEFTELFANAIQRLHDITGTDYNQIALGTKIDSHQAGLMVFADDIAEHKQRYRLVAMDGLMAKSYVTGNRILIDDVKNEKEYYCAVYETCSELVLPIRYGGKVIGIFNSEGEEINYYTKGMISRLERLLENFSRKAIELGYVGNMNQECLPYIHI